MASSQGASHQLQCLGQLPAELLLAAIPHEYSGSETAASQSDTRRQRRKRDTADPADQNHAGTPTANSTDDHDQERAGTTAENSLARETASD